MFFKNDSWCHCVSEKAWDFSLPRVLLRTLGSVHSSQDSHPCPSDIAPNASPPARQSSALPSVALSQFLMHPDELASEFSEPSTHAQSDSFCDFLCWHLTVWRKHHQPVIFSGVMEGFSAFIFTISGIRSEDEKRMKRLEVRGELTF